MNHLELNKRVAEALGLVVVNVPEECSSFAPGARWSADGEYHECDCWYAGTPEEIAEIEEFDAEGGYGEYCLKDYATHLPDAWDAFLKTLDPNRTSIHPWGNGETGLQWAIYYDENMIVSAPTIEVAICLWVLVARIKAIPKGYSKYVVRYYLD